MDEISLVEYDPRWPEQFSQEAARVRAALGEGLIVAVEHFGSTSVPGLSAKPIIDMLVGVRSVAEAREKAVPILEGLGYAFWYDNPNPAHLFFVKGLPPNGPRTHHIHMVEPGTFQDPKNERFLFWTACCFEIIYGRTRTKRGSMKPSSAALPLSFPTTGKRTRTVKASMSPVSCTRRG